MKLSILIPSLESRKQKLDLLLRSLYVQVLALPESLASDVEIVVDIDNKEVSTGEKRNRLLDRSRGLYIAFIDDDDHVYENYIPLILEKANGEVDCISTKGHYSIDGGRKLEWRLSKDFQNIDSEEGGQTILYRKANHLTPVKRIHALAAKFPHISNAEDKAYSEALNKYLITESVIDVPIYHYDYETTNKQY